ncbi:MAG: DNA phosphorothioation system restriction enzyme [Actinomycetota bacterium]|nr:DNA phosphorothioation system restriction enzyme [Actinomycetota bacterium]
MLSDLDLNTSYRSDRTNLLTDFYIPCLASSTDYSRAVGYFTSDVLSAAARGLPEFIRRNGKMRLVASPVLSEADVVAISEGYERRESILQEALLRQLDPSGMPDPVQQRLGFLAWLIAEGRLDIKIALVADNRGFGIYHEKIGIFRDQKGNLVVFTGSANESIGGLVSNFESIDVYCSWRAPDEDRVRTKAQDFEALWANETSALEVIDFPDAARKELLKLLPDQLPEFDPGFDPHRPRPRPRTVIEVTDGWGEPSIPAWLELRDYQKDAVKAWFRNDGKGIWRMATGTGKTVAALGLVSQVYASHAQHSRPLIVVGVCPFKHLVSQWMSEAKNFGVRPIPCMEATQKWVADVSDAVAGVERGYFPFLMVLVTNATFQSARFQQVLSEVDTDLLLIADEVHNLGAPGLRAALPESARYRLGLSATPERWFDDSGTQALFEYFGEVVYELDLATAISIGALCRYDYYPHLVSFDPDEQEQYVELSRRIAQLMAGSNSEGEERASNPTLDTLLIRRARLIAMARQKLQELAAVVRPLRRTTHNLFYCGDGQVEQGADDETRRQLDAVVRLLGHDMEMSVNSYTAETFLDEREVLRRRFAAGDLQGLVAIRCLDEGVDIPETRCAFILASSTNPKQFIQRRGRILRRSEGKERAEIHDFLVIPPELGSDETFNVERRLVRRELERVVRFADLAENGPRAMQVLLPMRQQYNLLDI